MEEITVGTLFGLGFMLLVTAVTVVIIWQVAASIRARATVSREQEYRRLADQAVATTSVGWPASWGSAGHCCKCICAG